MSATEIAELDRYRHVVPTRSGPASYLDTGGDGPAAVFVHGAATSSLLWRHVIATLAGERRCVAVDLPLHGQTPARPGQDLSLGGLATFVGDFCDALDLDGIDLVANDTGGAVAQIVATRKPARLRSFVLTNCETHTNVRPWAFLPTYLLARSGLLARSAPALLRDIRRARRRVYGKGYTDLERLPENIARAWLEPPFGTPAAAQDFQRLITSIRARDLLAIEPALRALSVPTLLVWGTGDPFFSLRWARWLRHTIPGVTGIVEIPDGRLWFPDERADEFTAALREHWRTLVA